MKPKLEPPQPPPGQPAPSGFVEVGPPQPWRPTRAGERLSGRFGGTRTSTGPFGQYTSAIIRAANGASYMVAGNALVKLENAGVRQGEDVVLEYMGKIPSSTHEGQAYHGFRVFVRAGRTARTEVPASDPQAEPPINPASARFQAPTQADRNRDREQDQLDREAWDTARGEDIP